MARPRVFILAAAVLGFSAAVWMSPPAGWSKARRTIVVVLINHDARISARTVRKAATSLEIQVNRDLRAWWPGPRVRLTIVPPSASFAESPPWLLAIDNPVPGSTTGGGHTRSGTGAVIGVVFPSPGVPWTLAASHELLEMLEDPSASAARNGYAFEICDPVENAGYDVRGVTVSDFVTPDWFRRRGGGPWDYLGLLNGPRRQLAAQRDG
jgi:hypothetical protein